VVNRLAEQSDKFNIVMVSPPYGMGLQQQVLEAPGISKILAADGLIVLQRESRENALEAPRGLCFRHTRIYGRTVFDFYEQVET
jgi:16S rRNA G966 N2-methylase RsmD